MRRRPATIILALALLAATAALGAAPAQAQFGFNLFNVSFTDEAGEPERRAGAHPFAMTTSLRANLDAEEENEGWLKDLLVEQVPGLVADTTAYPRCSTLEFLAVVESINDCPAQTQVGIAATATEPGSWLSAPVFNLTPPPGVLLRLGFKTLVPNIVIDVGLDPDSHRGTALSRNTPQLISVSAVKLQLWGDPSSSQHAPIRGICGFGIQEGLPPGDVEGYEFTNQNGEDCAVDPRPEPFLTLPTECGAGPFTDYEALSWEGDRDTGSAPVPAFEKCAELGFKPEVSARPTARAAQSPTGLDLGLSLKDEGLTSPGGRSQSQIRRVALRLPPGMTANPSVAEGLEVCTEADLARETLAAAPGQGCPGASKLGTIEVQSPLVEEAVTGSLYQAEPYANLAEDSLLAFYIVLRNRRLGILVKQPVKVVPDPATGRLEGITEDIPQLPFSSFALHFREGGRSPLITPPGCGTHTVEATIAPWSGTPAVSASASFEIVSGPDAAPCPAGAPGFSPRFGAGSQNNAAGRHSPFSMRLSRADGEQDMTRFSAALPPGVLGRLAGVDRCPEAQIALAQAKSGAAELASPSCPANSEIGSLSAGAGVASQLTYVSGSLYLAGPYNGAPLSVVAITPAVAGPFDIGTVVVREALTLDPLSAEVRVDGAASDPIPHILAGIRLNLRELLVDVDRPGFTLNPTSCAQKSTRATLWGSYLDPLGATSPESPVALSDRFQAAGCASLGFRPRLALRLKGGTRRGAHPSLRAALRARPGTDANIGRAVVTLPRSAFLEQAHIRTICTRVQYAAGPGNGARCPKGSRYGYARAFTPLLDEPLQGPVHLRSSDHKLPDLVASLRGIVDIEVVGRIDSNRGGIRTTFATVPDAPVSRFVLRMQGGRKGLVVNSQNLCRGKRDRARVRMLGHNGRARTLRPIVRPGCKGKRRAQRSAHRGAPR